MSLPAGRRRPWLRPWLRLAPVLVGAALVAAPTGWLASDRLERDNDFCNACHLSPEVPLHRDIRADFDARPPPTLAAAHARAGVGSGDAHRPFRCIDCHGGSGPLGRAQVKALAARDAFWYVVGRFEEPREMRFPLRDADCRKCHASYRAAAGSGANAFHGLAVHNADLSVRCVACHSAHERGGNPQAHFLRAAKVRAQCARCHTEFEEEG